MDDDFDVDDLPDWWEWETPTDWDEFSELLIDHIDFVDDFEEIFELLPPNLRDDFRDELENALGYEELVAGTG